MSNKPPFHQVTSEETSFKRVMGPTGQEALEVNIESVIRSLAGVTETRTQSFALSGEQAAKLVAALQTITENMLNLVDKSSQAAMQKYNEVPESADQDVQSDTEDSSEEEVVEANGG